MATPDLTNNQVKFLELLTSSRVLPREVRQALDLFLSGTVPFEDNAAKDNYRRLVKALQKAPRCSGDDGEFNVRGTILR